MKKYQFLLAAAALALGSCSSDEFLGENLPTTSGNEGAITFSSSKANMHRAQTHETSAQTLGYTFSVFGTKTILGTQDVVTNVFAHAETGQSIDDTKDYDVWYSENSANTTTTNTHDWEYVGEAGSHAIPSGNYNLATAQTIKYWDNAADKYNFVAYSATKGGKITNVTTSGFTFTGTEAELFGLYIADAKEVTRPTDGYAKSPVMFKFRAAHARVRVGFYETIPGYEITSMKFRYNDDNGSTETNAILDGSFPGGSGEITTTVTFDDGTVVDANKNHAIVTQTGNVSVDKFLDFGTFNIPATNLATDNANATKTEFKEVVPNVLAANIDPMKLLIDFTLYNTNTKETIEVKGASATVPAEYMKWENNYSYTYLFKISDKVNGSTGAGTTGLYPITFDAVVEDFFEDGTQNTTTTVSAYSITTYQEGTNVHVRVKNSSSTLMDLTNLKVYSNFDGETEADLDLTNFANATSESVTVDTNDNTKASFAGSAGTKYAIVYNDGSKNYYKIVEL